MADDNTFSKLPYEVVLKIFFELEDDPRNWARLSCVCRKFSSLISTVCCKSKCMSTFPSLIADLVSLSSTSSAPPGGWSSLYKIAVCCPGLRHSGILLDNSDFGLLRELGPDTDYQNSSIFSDTGVDVSSAITQPDIREGQGCVIANPDHLVHKGKGQDCVVTTPPDPCVGHDGLVTTLDLDGQDCCVTTPGPRVPEGQDCIVTSSVESREPETWTLYDDLYFDTVYDHSEMTSSSSTTTTAPMDDMSIGDVAEIDRDDDFVSTNETGSKKRKVSARVVRSHLASGVWNLSREQGNKLLASRFREDCLYICDWPGCVHMEDKRNYMLFRGMFKNFKRSRVWRTINDGNRSKVDLNCAFCSCKETWDLHSSFCLKRGFGFHDDGEPVVRAYVCENGHVSGAWTDLPLYS